MSKGSITSLFVRWVTNPKELRDIADLLEQSERESISFTIEAQIPIHIMIISDKIISSEERSKTK